MEKRKIIFDCDPGHDDIMAIMNALAHPEQLEILGYTTVCGNNYVDKITRNLCQVLTAPFHFDLLPSLYLLTAQLQHRFHVFLLKQLIFQ